jgi:hypothetical protein
VSDSEDTRVEELPPDETGPVPVTVVQSEPRWYGITPQGAVLSVGLAGVGVGVTLLVLGRTAVGAVIAAVGVVVLAGLARRPAAAALSGPAEVGRTMLSARLTAGRRLADLERKLDAIGHERDRRLRELGEAVYRNAVGVREPLRQELEELDRRADETRRELERTMIEARERIAMARLGTAATQAVSLEPYPPPDEGDVPEHPQIPEPYPPPDEGDRPEQPRIPETSPEPPEQPPEQGPN